jgi:hypothetical protein
MKKYFHKKLDELKKQKRIALSHGASAKVDEDCSQETIDNLNALVERVHNLSPEEIKEIKEKMPEDEFKKEFNNLWDGLKDDVKQNYKPE